MYCLVSRSQSMSVLLPFVCALAPLSLMAESDVYHAFSGRLKAAHSVLVND